MMDVPDRHLRAIQRWMHQTGKHEHLLLAYRAALDFIAAMDLPAPRKVLVDVIPTLPPHAAEPISKSEVQDDPWRDGYRHCMSTLTDTSEGHVWSCKWCRQDFAEWPGDDEACPGPDALCPRCRSLVVEHPWSHFADSTGEHPWVCGRCYADDHPGSGSLVVDPDAGHFGSQDGAS